jgi:chromosome segregation ATPase
MKMPLWIAGAIKWAPWGIAAAAAIGAYVLFLNMQISNLESERNTLNAQIETLDDANRKNVETIQGLERAAAQQTSRANQLQRSLNQAETDRDRALRVLRAHNLLDLARARPGLVENTINQGTQDALDELARETEEFRDGMENLNRRPQ